MLEVLILVSALTTLILIGIRFGLLEILAIILAVVALVPIAVSLYSYFSKRPKITYQVANKRIQRDGKEYLYQCWIGFSIKRGSVLVKDFYLSSEWDIIPENAPNSNARLEYMHLLEETGFTVTARFREHSKPTYPKSGRVYVVQFHAKEKKNKFKVRMVLDTTIDPMKQGIHSVFHDLFSYRMFAEATMNFDDLASQEGEFRSYYF
ncbi:hypothetical protein D4R47_01955 [archaeon]|nr:MAG: hypothetical protein D4R47_01955 [archaeon]